MSLLTGTVHGVAANWFSSSFCCGSQNLPISWWWWNTQCNFPHLYMYKVSMIYYAKNQLWVPSWIITWSKTAQTTLFPTCGETTIIKKNQVLCHDDAGCHALTKVKCDSTNMFLKIHMKYSLPCEIINIPTNLLDHAPKCLTNVICQAFF